MLWDFNMKICKYFDIIIWNRLPFHNPEGYFKVYLINLEGSYEIKF